ncbi:MAG: hypothetical protein ABI925_07835 [Verrucomicrobiota bacterium]
MATSRAQDQEGKLIDRLLRPNTELKNNAQDKKFLADRTSIHKQANVRTFYAEKKSRSKEFAGARDFSPWEFNARSFHGGKRAANSSSRTEIVNSDRNYSGRKLNDLRSAHLANRIASNRKFSGERPFLGKGKSQKALSQHDTPLSIDEVRELLNKNK